MFYICVLIDLVQELIQNRILQTHFPFYDPETLINIYQHGTLY